MLALLYNRNFARLFAGRLVTNIGDSIYFVAAMWLVWELTGNEFFTGLAGFLVLAPSGLQFLFGPLVDRWDLRRVLVGTQLIQGLLVLSVPIAAATGFLSVWLVLAVMPLLALLNQLVYPAQTAAIPRLVEQEELVTANSMFALAYQGVDAVFNALAGVLVAVVGAVALFTFDAVTFAVAAALFATLSVPRADGTGIDATPGGVPETPMPDSEISIPDPTAAPDGGRLSDEVASKDRVNAQGPASGTVAANPDYGSSAYLTDLKEGISYLKGTFVVPMLVGSVVINFALGATIAVLPSYGAHVGGAQGYGFLMAAFAIGILLGSLVASELATFAFGRLSIAAFLLSGVAWLAAVSVGWLPGTVALFAVAFVPVGTTNVLLISVIQAVVPERLLGRATAVLGSASAVATPFGALAGGAAASLFGPVSVIAVAGVGFLLLAGYVASVPSIRRLPAVGDIDTLAVES
jgi:MFS family permease